MLSCAFFETVASPFRSACESGLLSWKGHDASPETPQFSALGPLPSLHPDALCYDCSSFIIHCSRSRKGRCAVWACVDGGTTILVHFQRSRSVHGMITSVTKGIADRTAIDARNTTNRIEHGVNFGFHVHRRSDGLCGIVVSGGTYAARVANDLIDKFLADFASRFPPNVGAIISHFPILFA